MKDKPPSIQEWKALYDAAIEFKKIECWNWMWDSDIFGVQNPVNGEIGYCCIMGRLGKHFGLAVYLGTEGLEGYLRMRAREFSKTTDILHLQKCLMASFEDRKLLQNKDIQIIKMLGLKFRGRNSWPLFKNYLPGYHPWYLNIDEVRYLTLVLHQTLEVAIRFKEEPELLTPLRENCYLVRMPKKEGDVLKWRDEWLEPIPLEKTVFITKPVDKSCLERIKKISSQQQEIWEADFFYSPIGVKEKGERPYYPYIILWAEHRSGFILGFHMAKSSEYKSEFMEHFLSLIENTKSLPMELFVKKKEVFKLLEPITSELNIKLSVVEKLVALEDAQNNLFNFLNKRR